MTSRIRLLQTTYPHWGKHTGIHQFVRHLDPKRFQPSIFRHMDGHSSLQWPTGGLRQLLKSRSEPLQRKWYSLSDFAAELRAIPGCAFNTVQIVHYLDSEHAANYLPVWLAKYPFSRTKTVATFHQPTHMLDKLIEPQTIKKLDHVNLVSPSQVDYFRKYVGEDRISVILHGVDTDFFRPGSRTQDSDVLRVVTVGHWLRDWNAIARVTRKLCTERDIEFHVVTNKPNQLEASGNVIFHRNISDDGLRSLYQQSDILFLPLTDSTANNSLLEGIACGLPVISTRMHSVSAYLKGGEAMLFDNNRSADLADAIMHLKENPDIRKIMGKQARLRAEELCWQKIAPRYEELYSMLL